jgi:PAS domain S-box-containing protein
MGPSDSPREVAAGAPHRAASRFAQNTVDKLFDFSPDAILITDSHGIIREVNARTTELFGYTPEELTGQTIEILVPERFRGLHPHHRENYHAHPRARQMGAALNLYGRRKDGTEFPVDIMLKPVETALGAAVVSFVRDASEQHAAQEALRLHDMRLRSILDSVTDHAIYLLDPDGYLMTWNPGAQRIKGYSADEVLGLHFSRFFTQEDLDRGRPAELLQAAAENGHIEEEGWRVRKDGSRFWAHVTLTATHDSAGRLTGFSKITRDVTERRQAQESVLLELSNLLLANVDVRKLLGAFSASMRQMVPHDAATLGIYDEGSGKLRVQFFADLDGANPQHDEVLLDLDNSPAGYAFLNRKPLVVSSFEKSGFPLDSFRHHAQLGMQSGIWVPLIHRDRTIGALAVSSRLENAFNLHDSERLAQVAGQVAVAVNNAMAFKQLSELRDRLDEEKKYLEEEINLEHRFDDIVGESTGLRNVLREVETVAPTDATVLIEGETGTGKELLARAIHRLSSRADRAFIKLNCAAIPSGLLESELFGHEKGAFTGAIARKIGRLELAHEGTLFLDEVGEMPLDLQPKLLRALQEREIERLGGTRPISVNVRLIAATNRDLAKMVAEKTFRSDLFYRLKVFPISAPPLRDRAGDIPVLVRHFVSRHSRRIGKNIETIPDEAMEALCRWKWPGNIRELENFLERAVILSRGSALHVPLAELEDIDAEEDDTENLSGNPTLQAAERDHILRALREAKGVVGGSNGAAARLGLKRTTLNSKIKKLGIVRAEYI